MQHVLWATMLALVFSGCGKKADVKTTPSFLPYIDFQFPDDVSDPAGFGIAEDENSILEHHSQRIDRTIFYLNAITSRLNSDGVNATGTFEKKGSDGTLNGYVQELASSAYAYQAVICHGSTVVTHMKWSSDSQKIHAIRNFAVAIGGQPATDMVSQLTYDLTTSPTLEMRTQGKPYAKPAVVTAGLDRVIEYVEADRDFGGTMAIRGVADWYAANTTQFTADTYFTGQINSNGSGSYVAFRKFNSAACPGTFTETNLDAPGWCLGRNLDADARYTADERAAAWNNLKTIGIASEATLNSVSMDPELTCTPET